MTEIGASEAKNKLSALLDRVERGEEVVITRRGRAVAKLAPMAGGSGSQPRTGGRAPHPRARQGDEPRLIRLGGMEAVSRSSTPMIWGPRVTPP